MSGEKIVRALDAIPDEQLQSAMSVYDRKKKMRYIWVRVVAALIVLAVVVFLLLGCSNSANAASNKLLPDGPLLGVASWSYPSAPTDPKKDPLRGKITTDLAEEIRDCIQDLSLREVQWRGVYGQGMKLSFGYEDGSIEYLILTMRNDGHTFIQTWSWDVFYGEEKAHYYQLDSVQAAYLLDLIYEMLEESKQTA